MVDSIVDAPDFTAGNLDQLEQELTAAVSLASGDTKQKPAVKEEPKKDEDGDEAVIPPKLRGKSLTEIVGIYRDLESAYGRMANDLGTQRKLTDRILDLKRETDLGNNSAPAKVEIKSDELLENPTETLDRYIASREQPNQQRIEQLEQQIAAQAFIAKHPDFQSYTNNAEFTEWVQSSPTRARAAQAAASGDWSYADDLLTEYKAQRARAPKKDDQNDETEVVEVTEDKSGDLAGARKASLETSSQAQAGAKKGGKIYSRAALMRLMVERPDVYYSESHQAEIMRAYSEGRVK